MTWPRAEGFQLKVTKTWLKFWMTWTHNKVHMDYKTIGANPNRKDLCHKLDGGSAARLIASMKKLKNMVWNHCASKRLYDFWTITFIGPSKIPMRKYEARLRILRMVSLGTTCHGLRIRPFGHSTGTKGQQAFSYLRVWYMRICAYQKTQILKLDKTYVVDRRVEMTFEILLFPAEAAHENEPDCCA